MKKYAIATLMVLALCLRGPQSAFGVSREIQYIMEQLDALQQMIQNMRKNMDAQAADMRNLIDQNTKNVNAMKATVSELQKATEHSLASANARFDSMTGQIQALTESLEEAKSRLAKLSEQVAKTQNIIETLNTPAPGTGTKNLSGSPSPSTGPTIPDAQTVYNSALSYYNGGQYQLAIQAFQEYLQYYGDTELASNAQFYTGESYYSMGDYKHAIEEYNKAVERYPGGNKEAAAQLKKGYALLALGQNQAGVRELRSVAQRYPNSHEAALARQRLRKLGVTLPARRGD